MRIPAVFEVIAGLVVVWLAIRMWQGRVARGSGMGVRTPSTTRSDAAFQAANKAAAPVTGIGGLILAACGVLVAFVPRHVIGAFLFGGVAVFLVLCVVGAMIGVRASARVQPPN